MPVPSAFTIARICLAAEPVGAENRVTLCDLLLFADESTETITLKNVKTAVGL